MKFYYPIQNGSYVEDNKSPDHHHDNETYALDLEVPVGTEVYAITNAIVNTARATDEYNSYSTGKCVVLKFNIDGIEGNLYAAYMHMSKVDVKEGQAVSIGQKIGLSGNTGKSDGPHLHIQILKEDEWEGSNILVGHVDGEEYRVGPYDKMPLTEKLFKNLKVQYGSEVVGDWINFVANGKSDIPTIYDGLRTLGFSKNAAIGAIANISHESNYITHMIGSNSTYFISFVDRSQESLLDLMNSATSGNDLYNKIQSTSTNGELVGYGLTQFTSEINLSALYDYHISTGLGYDTLGAQLPAFKQVLEKCNLFDGANNCSSPGDAAYYLCLYYEVPQDRYSQAEVRRNEANNLVAEYDFYD